MSPLTRILIGLGVIIVSFLAVWKTETVQSIFGRNDWAERTLGVGQTKTFYKMVAVGTMMLGAIILTDVVDILFGDFLRKIFGGTV